MSLEEQIQEIIEKALAKGSVSAKDINKIKWDSNEERQRYVKELEGIANLDAMTELSK